MLQVPNYVSDTGLVIKDTMANRHDTCPEGKRLAKADATLVPTA